MVFSSLFFIFFFLPSAIFFNFLSRKSIKIQNFILMLFSLGFYYWGEKNRIIIMLACIFVNYLAGILIDSYEDKTIKKIYLTISIVISIGLLGYFKYFNFFIHTTDRLFHANINELVQIALPLGISFYTFHAISYVMDVYWGKIKAEKNLITFVSYVSLFPQLIAGPIVRYADIGKSFYQRHITRAGFSNGIQRFCFGLGKKVLIANTVAMMANNVFALPSDKLDCALAWSGAIAYMIQIYFDFSGYSDMAIGIGLMLGFKYKENFKFPYKSLSIQEFWRRWHISLSSWFRDYVYIPLGGSRKSESRTYLNLLAIFLFCGLWHGASYTFIVWGLYHGLFLILERTKIGEIISKLPNIVRHFYVLLVVLIGWIFFREDQTHKAISFIKTMFVPSKFATAYINSNFNVIVISAYMLGIILSLGLNEYIKDSLKASRNVILINLYKQLTIAFAVIVLLLSLLPLSNNSYSPFLYFRF